MKRAWTAILATLAMVGTASQSEALYSPNPAARWAEGHFFLAGDFEYNSEKDIDGGGEIEDVKGFYARPGYTLLPNVIVYGRLGVRDGDNLDSGIAVGGGIQGAYVLPSAPEWAIGGAFDILHWDTELDGPGNVDYTEFQITPAVSYNIPQIPALTPYAGLPINFLSGDLEEDDTIGLLFGTNFDVGSRLRFDAQVRIIHETGFGLSVGYLF